MKFLILINYLKIQKIIFKIFKGNYEIRQQKANGQKQPRPHLSLSSLLLIPNRI